MNLQTLHFQIEIARNDSIVNSSPLWFFFKHREQPFPTIFQHLTSQSKKPQNYSTVDYRDIQVFLTEERPQESKLDINLSLALPLVIGKLTIMSASS